MISHLSSDEKVIRPVLNSAWPLDVGEQQQSETAMRRLEERLAMASADIRNALVPLQTVAALLQRSPDVKTQDWCSWMLRREVRHIIDILERLADSP
jgi:hypothetical protein